VAGTRAVSGDEGGETIGANAGGEEIVIGIGRVSAVRVLTGWGETEGAELRGIVGEETGSGRDVNADNGVREEGVGKSGGTVAAM
jgi:hypothetical protein